MNTLRNTGTPKPKLPAFDSDKDGFGDTSILRGNHWRGLDCNKMSSAIYPGRKTGSKILDQDCNGIYGSNAQKKSYED